jgi:RNA recognition motif. (a.k.a. RRM, RBD, or RNP domain)
VYQFNWLWVWSYYVIKVMITVLLAEELMREHFGQFGTVQDVRVFKDKGFAFIR